MIWDLENKFVSILEYDKECKRRNSERQSMRLVKKMAKAKESRSAEIKPWQKLSVI